MIVIYQGSPGSGKSMAACQAIYEHLCRPGRHVATNFSFSPGWVQALASYRQTPIDRLLGRIPSVSDLFDIWRRAWKIGTPDTVGQLGDILRQEYSGRVPEGTGLLVLDEAQLQFNSRNWGDNYPWIEFFTQHRKLGWDVILVAHDVSMIDKQIRPLIEYEVRLRSLKNIKLFGRIPLARKHRAFVIWRYAGISAGSGNILKRELSGLGPWASLYDTLEVFAFDSASRDLTHHGSDPTMRDRIRAANCELRWRQLGRLCYCPYQSY